MWANVQFGHDQYHLLKNVQEMCDLMDKTPISQIENQDLFNTLIRPVRDHIQPTDDMGMNDHISSHLDQCQVVLFTPFHIHPVESLIPCGRQLDSQLTICSKTEEHARGGFGDSNDKVQIQRPSAKQILLNVYKCDIGKLWIPFNRTCFKVKYLENYLGYQALAHHCQRGERSLANPVVVREPYKDKLIDIGISAYVAQKLSRD